MRHALLFAVFFTACVKANGAPTSADEKWAAEWMARHCVTTLIEPGKACSLCQGTGPSEDGRARNRALIAAGKPADMRVYDFMVHWDDAGWKLVTARLGGVAAIERGVTYCEKR